MVPEGTGGDRGRVIRIIVRGAGRNCKNEVIFLRQAKDFLPSPIDDNIIIRGDNERATKMTTNRFSSRRTRHVDVKHHIVRDAVESGVVQTHYVKSGEQQHNGVLTKALDVNTFETHARVLLNARAGSMTF